MAGRRSAATPPSATTDADQEAGVGDVLARRERARELGFEGERVHDIPNATFTIAGVTKETQADD